MIKAQKQQRGDGRGTTVSTQLQDCESMGTGRVFLPVLCCVPAPPGVFLPVLDLVCRFN